MERKCWCMCVSSGNRHAEEWWGGKYRRGKTEEMAGPSNIWEGAGGARADLGVGRVMPDEAGEEGGVLKNHIFMLRAMRSHCRVLSRRVTLSNLCFRKPTRVTGWEMDWRKEDLRQGEHLGATEMVGGWQSWSLFKHKPKSLTTHPFY